MRPFFIGAVGQAAGRDTSRQAPTSAQPELVEGHALTLAHFPAPTIPETWHKWTRPERRAWRGLARPIRRNAAVKTSLFP